MKTRFGIAIVIVVAVTALWLFWQKPAASPVKITMSSVPFPLVIGPTTTLLIAVTGSDGTPVDADVTVSANMMMEGMLPVDVQAVVRKDDLYQVPVMWPMAGQWMVEVSAKLLNGRGTLNEEFEVYVYSTVVDNPGGPTEYRSASDNHALDNDPAHQMVIVIPQGTRILMQLGQAPDIIPTKVYFKVNGQNTLVIKNNDVVDHTIGPYVVHAGETLRQTFTRAATFQGKCSVNARSTVSIIVDE